MQRRKLLLIGCICLLLVMLAAPFTSSCTAKAPEQIKITLITPLPTFIKGQWPTYQFIERVNERAEGRLFIDYLGGPEVIETLDQPEAVRTGAVDMISTWTIMYMARVPEAYVIPFSQITPTEMRENGFYDLMVEVHEEGMNVRYLGLAGFNRWFFWFVNFPVTSLDDLKGHTIMSYDLQHAEIRALGMTPIYVPQEDYYDALERGVADGMASPHSDADEFGHGEVVDSVILPGSYGASNVSLLMNLDKWNTIPKDLQKLMGDVIAEIEPEIGPYFEQYDATAWANLQAAGVKAVRFSPEEEAYFENIRYEAGWNEIKPKLSPESYNRLRELLMVRDDYAGMYETRGWGRWGWEALF